MSYIEALVNKSFVTEKGKKLLVKYERSCEDDNLKPLTMEHHTWILNKVLTEIGKPVEDITAEDLSKYWKEAKEKCSDTYVNNMKVTTKAFFNRTGSEDLAKGIKPLKPKDTRKLPKKLVDREILKELLSTCGNSRNRALVFSLFESGARKSEILALNCGDLIADEHGFVAIITGKTGERRIRLIDSAPDIRTWLNDHPDKRSEAPLWVSLSPRGYGKRLHKESLQQIFENITQRTGLDFKVYPHLLRHSRATELASMGFSETQLCVFFGWEFKSPMPRTYIERSGVDVDSKLLEASGIKAATRKELKALRVTCPECEKPQSPVASFCFDCGALLPTEAAKTVKSNVSPIREELEDVKAVLREMPEYKEAMRKLLEEKGEKLKD